MSTRLVIDNASELKELKGPEPSQQPKAIRFAAKIISFVFHPVFVPVYIVCFLVAFQPILLSSFTLPEKILVILRFFLMYSFFPVVTVLLARALGFLDSIYLKTQKERIIPYISSMIFYFWMWYVLRNQPQFSSPVVILTFAIFLASIIGLMANIYMKISIHAISMGIMVTFMISLAFTRSIDPGLSVSITLLVAGLVCTSRFIVSDHTPNEIYGGLFAGIAAQIAADLARGVLY